MEDITKKISILRKVRPVRLAFLVEPEDKDGLLDALRINTCVWGGASNCIVPTYSRRPSWWKDYQNTSGKNIVQGYLENIEPDYIVESTKGLAQRYGYSDSVHLASHFFDTGLLFGLNVAMPLIYDFLFQTQLQFVHKNPLPGVSISAEKNWELLAAACFGAFPLATKLGRVEKSFKKNFEPVDVQLTSKNLISSQLQKAYIPIRLTRKGIYSRIVNRIFFGEYAICLVDPTSFIDILDFWNLKANYFRVIAMPIDIAFSKIEECLEIVKNNSDIPTPIMRGRSVDEAFQMDYARQLGAATSVKQISCNLNYPRMWSIQWHDKDVGRIEEYASEDRFDLLVENNSIDLSTDTPSFFKTSFDPSGTWVNVFSVQRTGLNREIATVYPRKLDNLRNLLDQYSFSKIGLTSEGITLRTSDTENRNFKWNLLDGETLFTEWFKQQGLFARIDVKGKLVQQIVRTLGNLHELKRIQSKELIELLNNMSHGLVSFPDEEQSKERARTRSKFISRDRWWKLLMSLNGKDVVKTQKHFDFLVDRGVLNVGLVQQCPSCDHRNWYPPDELGKKLICERCFSGYSFPAALPPNKDSWQYRTRGVFSVDNYIQGSYSVAFTLRFLICEFAGETTWTPTFKLKGLTTNDSEIDFALWWQYSPGVGTEHLVLGECKTFDRFKANDFARAKLVLRRFPGCIYVFATLRNTLTRQEISALRKLATQGKVLHDGHIWRNLVIVLTGNELLSPDRFPQCWLKLGGSYTQMGKNFERKREHLIDLVFATQELYLHIPRP